MSINSGVFNVDHNTGESCAAAPAEHETPDINNHLGNPWTVVQRSTFAPQRSVGKRRRRAPASAHTLSSLSTSPPTTIPQVAENNNDDEAQSSESDQDDTKPPSRRKMRPAVAWMSVKHERKALQEIRNMDEPMQHAKDLLQSIPMRMTVEEFALHYVLG